MKYLALNLKGYTQHYPAGNHLVSAASGKDIVFKTSKAPTKRAVVGMIGAALGLPRGDEELDRLCNSLDFKYETLKTGEVVDDYQTARPLYEGDAFIDATGTLKGKRDAIVKHVEYLLDYEFKVYVGGSESELERIRSAFDCPVFPPHLGKRNCFPLAPLVTNRELISLEGKEHVHDCA